MKRSLLCLALVACGGQTVDMDSAHLAFGSTDPLPAVTPAAARPEPVANGVGTPSAIVLDGTRVVFTTRATELEGRLVAAGGLFVADKRVGPALLIGLDRQGATYIGLATDGATAFVATSDARIVAFPLAGGAETEIATLPAAAIQVVVAGDYVYVAYETGGLWRIPKAGGAPEALGFLSPAIRGLVADGKSVVVATADGTLSRVDDAGVKPLATAPGQPCAVARDADRLYWTASDAKNQSAILRVGLAGGEATTIASGTFAACALAADAKNLYFVTTLPDALAVRSSGAAGLGLMSAPIGGGTAVAVAQSTHALAQPGAVAVDETHLYWLTASSVMRLAK